jgi:hypothetical protein
MGAGRPEGSCHSKGLSPLSLVWIVVSFTVVPWHLLGPVGLGRRHRWQDGLSVPT